MRIIHLLAIVLMISGAPVAQAQGIPSGAVVTLSQERFFQSSDFGKRVQQELQARAESLSRENRQIEAELIAEERALTDDRPNLDPDVFRQMAEEFDARVTEIRRAQADKARDIQTFGQAQRDVFFERAVPVLLRLMEDTGAVAILNDSAVILSRSQTDITEMAVQRIDAAFAASENGDPSPRQPTPDAPLLVPQGAD